MWSEVYHFNGAQTLPTEWFPMVADVTNTLYLTIGHNSHKAHPSPKKSPSGKGIAVFVFIFSDSQVRIDVLYSIQSSKVYTQEDNVLPDEFFASTAS